MANSDYNLGRGYYSVLWSKSDSDKEFYAIAQFRIYEHDGAYLALCRFGTMQGKTLRVTWEPLAKGVDLRTALDLVDARELEAIHDGWEIYDDSPLRANNSILQAHALAESEICAPEGNGSADTADIEEILLGALGLTPKTPRKAPHGGHPKPRQR